MGQFNRSLDQDTPAPDRTRIGGSRVAMIHMIVRTAFNSHYVTFSSLVHAAPHCSIHPATHRLGRYLPTSIDDAFQSRQEQGATVK
jgi:hypothetical protein